MSGASATSEKIPVRVYGGPTTVIEYGGLRFVTDPTFDPPGDYPMPLPGDHKLVKTEPSPVTAAGLGRVDAVLLSHDTHDDNLDYAGRAFLPEVPVVLTTDSGAGRLGGNARGLAFWETAEIQRPDGTTVTVTGVPARHGPIGCEPVTGDVIGFVLTSDDLPSVYVSGDNAALEHVKEIAQKFAPVDTAVLFLGGARMAFAFDGALLTLDSAQGAEAARILGARRVVPAHFDSWAHFKEGRNEIEAAFAEAGLADRLHFAR
ncbi:L-ascorbate metabolism protein UlaG (beta-lactamase superfamily) [Streptomyces canus]|uniref:MBL fold metallo-hydrolase n=1 Tax=Streptomyces canus TaxID=58343 RepID=UPI00278B6510|nr:MBL fold metallo-hydrolase [Streptomyces canus]MDQ0604552.1 L-ascorbate metabolism protein UlaG (beta-lactamase superfamily) [Streptomyces canus]